MAARAQANTLAAHELSSAGICNDMIAEVVACEVRRAAATALAEAEQSARNRTARLAANFRRRRLGQCFRGWATLARKSHHQRTALFNFPSGPAAHDLSEQNRRLSIGSLTASRAHAARSLSQVVQQRADWEWRLRAADEQESARQAAILQPFNLVPMLENSTLGGYTKERKTYRYFLLLFIFYFYFVGKNTKSASLSWKLILSCPDMPSPEDKTSAEFVPLIQTLRRKFQKSLGHNTTGGKEEEDQSGLLVCRTVPGQRRPGTTVAVCVRQVGRSDLEAATFSEAERKRLFSGASGLLVLVGLHVEDCDADLQRLDSGKKRVLNCA